jgi:hypothetical protein
MAETFPPEVNTHFCAKRGALATLIVVSEGCE